MRAAPSRERAVVQLSNQVLQREVLVRDNPEEGGGVLQHDARPQRQGLRVNFNGAMEGAQEELAPGKAAACEVRGGGGEGASEEDSGVGGGGDAACTCSPCHRGRPPP